MNDTACHATEAGACAPARAALLDVVGAKRVAGWCGVKTDTVYQWLHRGTATAPIPAAHAVTILREARNEGLEIETSTLLPGMPA